jgi:hypothetical protein
MGNRQLAPVIFFAYDRPDHAARSLRSLSANRLAGESHLFVYCDGPPEGAQPELSKRIEATRDAVRREARMGGMTIVEAETNLGLMKSIERGTREVLAAHDRAIIVEDDLEVSPGFLEFMNAALDRYAAEEDLMHVSGYMFPVQSRLPDAFFLKIMASWGWATWRRAFQHYREDAAALLSAIQASGREREFNLDGNYDYLRQLRANAEGRRRTWAVKWYASMFLRGGLGLFPQRSLVRNFGHDGTGQNSAATQEFDIRKLADHAVLPAGPISENAVARRAVGRFLGPTIPQRMLHRWRSGTRSLISGLRKLT